MPRPAPIWLVIVSALIGAVIAIPVTGEQISIDGALALTGIVKYAPEQFMAQFHFRWWTLVNQSCALLLWLGVSQSIVAVAPAILAIGLITSGMAMLIYGVTKDPWIALLAAVFCVCTGTLAPLFASPDFGTYGGRGILNGPIGSTAIYGLSAGALSTFAIGALTAGRNTLSGFCVGILLSVHPVMGTFVGGMMLGLFMLKATFLRLPLEGVATGLLAGWAASALSFLVFWLMSVPAFGKADPGDFAIYLNVWDSHRTTAMPVFTALRILLGCSALICLCAVIVAHSSGRSVQSGAALIALSTTSSAILYFAVHLFPQVLPEVAIRAIPGRFIDIHAYVAGPLFVAAGLFLFRHLLQAFDIRRSRFLPIVAIVLLSSPIWISQLMAYSQSAQRWLQKESPYDNAFWTEIRTLKVGPVLASQTAYYPAVRYGHLSAVFDPGDFDFTAYLPNIVGQARQFIEKGFGIPFSDPPREMRHRANLGAEGGREYWQTARRSDWSCVARDLGFSAVLAPTRWTIDLPKMLSSQEFTLYAIQGQCVR
jgi:hypothetical protein